MSPSRADRGSPTGVINELAQAEGAHIDSANLLDVGDHFTKRLRMRSLRARVLLYAGDRMLQGDIQMPIPIAVVLTRSTPRSSVLYKDAIATIDDTRVFPWGDLAAAGAAVKNEEVQRAISSLRLRDGEEFVASREGGTFTFHALDARDAIARLDAAICLLSVLQARFELHGGKSFEAGESQSPRLTPLPGVDTQLAAEVSSWAISDDEKRAEMIKAASKSDLDVLIAFAAHQGENVEGALESLDAKDPEAAAEWGAVLEAAAEARLELARRK